MQEEAKKQFYYKKEYTWHYNKTIKSYNICRP